MKKTLIFLLAVLMISCLAACGSGGSHSVDDTERTRAHQTEQGGGAETAFDTATVEVAYADEALLAGADGFDEFNDYDSEYQVKLVFTTDMTVSDFKFLSLSFVDADENGNVEFDVEELYTAGELSPQRPLVIGMTFVGSIPDRGISYVDADGTTRYYSVEMSGDDGSPMLIEFMK